MARVIWDTAQVYRELKKYEKANELYQHVIDNWPKAEHAILSRGGVIMADIGLGNDANAQAAIDSLIADFNDQPALPEAVFVIGEQYYNDALLKKKEGRDEQAKEYYRKALTVWERIMTDLLPSPITPQAYLFSGECYRKLSQHQTAIEYYQEVVVNWPDYQFAWHAQFLLARCFERLARLGRIPIAEAAPQIRQACENVFANYPDCLAAGAARNLLKRWSSINSQ